MAEDKKARDAIEHTERSAQTSKRPPARPHAEDRLTDREKTPGTGSLPEPGAKETDAGPD